MYRLIADFGVISIHALREEGDQVVQSASTRRRLFLSTPSARRATRPLPALLPSGRISIHALREEGDAGELVAGADESISIHALREEGDALPCGCRQCSPISIHALREEGDALHLRSSRMVRYFYPRPPRGGRPRLKALSCSAVQISIHALREEGDRPAGD